MSHNIAINIIASLLHLTIYMFYAALCLGIVAAVIQIVLAIAPMIFLGAFITGIGTAIIRGS